MSYRWLPTKLYSATLNISSGVERNLNLFKDSV